MRIILIIQLLEQYSSTVLL